MNRKFIKISVSIVALLLALVMCFTSCSGKIDDVTADLNSTKDEVAANKADATAALEAAVKDLEAKINAKETNLAAEIAKVNEAIAAVKTSGAEADAELAKAQEALQASVNLVQENLEATKKEVSDKLAANDAALNEKVAELNQAIADAKEVLKLADATDVARLLETIEGVQREFGTKIEEVVANVQEFKAQVEFWVSELEDADAETLAQAKAELEALLVKVGEMDTQVKADLGVEIADAIKVVNDRLETYKLTTDDVIDAFYSLNNLLKIYQEVSVSYGATYKMDENGNPLTYAEGDEIPEGKQVGDVVEVDLDKALLTVQIKLYRATTPEEVFACKNEFYAAIENIGSDNLTILRAVYEKLLFAEAELANDDDPDPATVIDMAATREALMAARAALDETFTGIPAKLIVGGEVIDLWAMYADLWADYCAERISIIKDYIAAAEEGIKAEDVTYDALWAVNGEEATISDNLLAAREELDALLADNATLADEDKVSDEKIADLEELYDVARQNRVKKAIEFVTAEIADVTVSADVDRDATEDAETTVDSKLAAIKAENDTITTPVDMTAVNYARDVKYVELYAKELTAAMNGYIDNLGAIYADVTREEGTASAIDTLRTDYTNAFVDETYAEIYANPAHIAVAAAKEALLAAEAKFQVVEAQDDELAQLVADAKEIAAILDNEEFTTTLENDLVTYPNISGTETEYNLIVKYTTELAKWVDAFDAFVTPNEETGVVGFTLPARAENGVDFVIGEETTDVEKANADAYATIRDLVGEDEFAEIKKVFDEAIAELMEAARNFIDKVDALENATIQEDGSYKFYFTTYEDLNAMWATHAAWVGLAGDDAGVGFVVELASDGQYTQKELVETFNRIDNEFTKWTTKAKQDWDTVYTDEVKALTLENVTIYNDKILAAVIDWFETYCYWNNEAYECIVNNEYAINATTYSGDALYSDADGAIIGTSEVEAVIRGLDAKRAELLAGAQAGITSITNNEFAAITQVSTHAADVATIEAARAAYDKWVKDYRIEVDNTRNAADDLAVEFDITKLTDAETKLDELEERLAALILAIEGDAENGILGLDTDLSYPYFKNDSVKNMYKMNVEMIMEDINQFAIDNNCEDEDCFTLCCTECISQDLQDKLEEANLFVLKYETIAALTAKVEEAKLAIAGATNEATLIEELDNYLDKNSLNIDYMTINTKNYEVVLSAYSGSQADKDIAEIIAKVEMPTA